MTIIILLSIFILFYQYTGSSQKAYIVKKINEYTFVEMSTGAVLKEGRLLSEYFCDSSGRRIKKIDFDQNHNITFIVLYEYDNDTVKDYFKVVTLKKKGDTVNVSKARTSRNGSVIRINFRDTWFFCGDLSNLVKCTYNNEGYLNEAIQYDEYHPDLISRHYLYKYEYW